MNKGIVEFQQESLNINFEKDERIKPISSSAIKPFEPYDEEENYQNAEKIKVIGLASQRIRNVSPIKNLENTQVSCRTDLDSPNSFVPFAQIFDKSNGPSTISIPNYIAKSKTQRVTKKAKTNLIKTGNGNLTSKSIASNIRQAYQMRSQMIKTRSKSPLQQVSYLQKKNTVI